MGTAALPAVAIDNPTLNSPFAEPSRHWVLDENGVPTGIPAAGRRRSEFVVPVPPPKHRDKGQLGLENDRSRRESNDYINEIRSKVAARRALGEAGLANTVTPATARLLRYWRDPARQRRLFFCQIEAAETAIWLAEVAPRAGARPAARAAAVRPRQHLRSARHRAARDARRSAPGAG